MTLSTEIGALPHGTSRLGRGILDPIGESLRPLPPLAYLPLIIIIRVA